MFISLKKPTTQFSHKMFPLYSCLMVCLWLKMRVQLLANVSNKETKGNVCSNLVYFVHIWNISIITSSEILLKLKFLFIFQFRFD